MIIEKNIKSPKVSVVVIALNSENTVERTLLSIKKQKLLSFECICVDDGSIDDTGKIFNKFANNDSRFRVISHNGNKGCLTSRYDGLMAAQGKYILFIDSDDYYEKNTFEVLCNKMEKDNLEICEFGVNPIFASNNTLSKQQIKEFSERYISRNTKYNQTEDILKACFETTEIKVNVWNKIYRTDLVKQAFSDFDSEMIVMEEDWLFSFLVLSLAKKFETIDKKLINYSIGLGVSTNNKKLTDNSIIQHASAMRVYKLIEQSAKTRNINNKQEILSSIHYQLMRFAIADFANSCDLDKCQLFLDTMLQYCEINDILITFSYMASEGVFIDTEGAINKLRICQLPSKEARAYVNSLSLYEGINNIKKVEEYLKNTTTWKVGRFVTYIPRKIKDYFIAKGKISSKDEGIDIKKISISSFEPVMPLNEMHNFASFKSIVKSVNGIIINEKDFLSLEYKQETKLLIVTDNFESRCVQKTIDYCIKNNIYLTIIDFNTSIDKNINLDKKINLIACKELEKLSLSKYVDLYDGLIIDVDDYWTTINFMRCACRNTLILTNKSIRVGLQEKYCLRKEYNLDKYIDWLIFGNIIKTNDLISVIIPTLNAGDEFDKLLNSIENQKYVVTPEIIIIDSGSKDNTVDIAKKHNARVYTISKEEFSHSKIRNMGADLANGKYLLFTTQDAIPSSYLTYCRLLNEIYTHQISAISPAEEYREDADLFAKMMIYEYKIDYFFKSPIDIKILNKDDAYIEMRRSSSLDDVMCLTAKNIFEKYRYRFSYAEDCDYGHRLILDGYSIERTNKIKVIHSHNRTADYFFKRSIVDAISIKKIYNNASLAIGDYRILCNRAISFYALTELFIKEMKQKCDLQIDYTKLQAYSKECAKYAFSTLRKVNRIEEIIQYVEVKNTSNVEKTINQILPLIEKDKPILQDLYTFENYLKHIIWLKSNEVDLFDNHENEEIYNCLKKYAACQIGFFLGSYISIQNGSCKKLDNILSKLDLSV